MKKKLIFLLLVSIIIFTATGCFFNSDDTSTEAIDLSKTRIKLTTDRYDYTGKEICPGFKVFKQDDEILDFSKVTEHEDLIITYENNVNVGKATIKVSAKDGSKNYKGQVNGFFVIKAVDKIVDNADSFIKSIGDVNNNRVSLGSDIIVPSDANIVLHNKCELNTNGYNLTNNGNIIVEGKLNINCLDNRVSNIVNNGVFTFKNDLVSTILNAEKDTLFFNKGKLVLDSDELKGNRDRESYLLSDTPILDSKGNKLFVKKDSSPYFFYRRPLTEFDITVSNDNTYTGDEIRPKVKILNSETQSEYYLVNNCDVTLTNNVNAGTGLIKLTAKEMSKYFTGEITKEFTINKADIVINESEYNLLNDKLSNGNYNEITLIGNYNDEIIIPEKVSLIIKDNTLTPTIINNGQLKLINTNESNMLKIKRLTNNGLLEISGNNVVVDAVLDGVGNIKINNDLFLSENGNISNTKVDTNYKIYYNELNQISNVNLGKDKLIKREKFNVNDNLRIDNNHYDYDKKYREMIYTFVSGGADLQCLEDGFVFNIADKMLNAGEYPFSFEFLPISKCFYGKDEGIFYIDKTSIVLNNEDKFDQILDSNNYDNITLLNPTFLSTNRQYIVPQDTTIIIDKNAALYNNTFVDNGLIKSCLILLGKILNNGIYSEIGDRNLSLRPETDEDYEGNNIGIIENNGNAYFNEVTEANKKKIRKFGFMYPILADGNNYIRKNINECTVNVISDECTFAKKDGVLDRSNLIPDANVIFNGIPLVKATDLISMNSDFAIIGYNNYHITSKYNETYALITACYSSEKVYGNVKIDYTINPGSINVANFDELKDALNDSANYDQLDDYICDWKEVIVTGDIQYTGKNKTYITVASNVNLRTGNFSVDLYSTEKDLYYHNYICEMFNYGKIFTSCKTYNFDMKYNAKNKGKTIGEAHDLEDFKSYMRYDEIILMTDLTTQENNKHIEIKTNTNQEYHGAHRFTINLNGHSIEKLLINSDGRQVIVNGNSESIVKDLYLEGMKNDIDYGKQPNSIVLNDFTVDYLTFDTSYEEKYTVINNMTINNSKVHDVIEIPKEGV